MRPKINRSAAICLLCCLVFVGSLAGLLPLAGKSAHPSASVASKRQHRPWLLKYTQIVAAYKGDLALVTKALADLRVEEKVKKICYASPRKSVSCIAVGDVLNKEVLHPADRSLLQLALNDLLNVVGAPEGADVLTLCGDSTNSGVTHLIPIKAEVGSSPSALLDSLQPGPRGVSKQSRLARTWSLSGGRADTLTSACRDAQGRSIQAGLGAYTPGDPGYRDARENAVAAMDAAVQNCKDSGSSIFPADPAGDSSATPPTGTDANPDTSRTDNADESGTDASANGDSGGEAARQQNALEAIVSVLNLALGTAETIIEAVGPSMGMSGSASPVSVAVGVVGAVAGAAGLAGNETAETVGNTAQVVSTLTTVSKVVSAGQLKAVVSSEAAATTAGVVSAEAALFPVLAAGFGGYAAVRLANTVTDGRVDRKAVDAFGVLADAKWRSDNAAPAGGDVKRPVPGGVEGGKPLCAAMQANWQRFKNYCSQPGNNWRTYDCMLFVARLNGCADPALINPGPNGDYACASRCPALKGLARSAKRSVEGEAGAGTCQQERLVAACEAEERRKGVETGRAGAQTGGRSGCKDSAAGVVNLQQQLKELVLKDMCQRVSAGSNGLCGRQRSRRPGEDDGIRRQ
jgi:hypothetical protein